MRAKCNISIVTLPFILGFEMQHILQSLYSTLGITIKITSHVRCIYKAYLNGSCYQSAIYAHNVRKTTQPANSFLRLGSNNQDVHDQPPLVVCVVVWFVKTVSLILTWANLYYSTVLSHLIRTWHVELEYVKPSDHISSVLVSNWSNLWVVRTFCFCCLCYRSWSPTRLWQSWRNNWRRALSSGHKLVSKYTTLPDLLNLDVGGV